MYHCETNAILFLSQFYDHLPNGLNHLGSLASPDGDAPFDDEPKFAAFDLRACWDVAALLSLPNFEFDASEYCLIPL